VRFHPPRSSQPTTPRTWSLGNGSSRWAGARDGARATSSSTDAATVGATRPKVDGVWMAETGAETGAYPCPKPKPKPFAPNPRPVPGTAPNPRPVPGAVAAIAADAGVAASVVAGGAFGWQWPSASRYGQSLAGSR